VNVGTTEFPMSYTCTPEIQRVSDFLVVVGCAECVWDDISSVSFNGKDVLVLSDMGMFFPGTITHWASCHPNIIVGGKLVRDQRRYHEDFLSHIPDYAAPKIGDVTWTIPKLAGTSGMFGTLIGIGLGYTKIILAGIPLNRSGHFWNPKIKVKFDKSGIRLSWQQISQKIFNNKVRSLSGWTRELLGSPTEEWLNVK